MKLWAENDWVGFPLHARVLVNGREGVIVAAYLERGVAMRYQVYFSSGQHPGDVGAVDVPAHLVTGA